MEYYYLNKEQRVKDGQLVREELTKRYNWDTILPQLVDYLKSITN
jgi:hypothetical protein